MKCHGARRRPLLQYAAAILLALAGPLLWWAAIAVEVDVHSFDQHAVRVTATVDAMRQRGKSTDYLVSFRLPDGSTTRGWTQFVNEYRIGDLVQVAYDRRNPTSVLDDRRLETDSWFAVVALLPLGGVLLWCSTRVWRAEPAKWRLRHG